MVASVGVLRRQLQWSFSREITVFYGGRCRGQGFYRRGDHSNKCREGEGGGGPNTILYQQVHLLVLTQQHQHNIPACNEILNSFNMQIHTYPMKPGHRN